MSETEISESGIIKFAGERVGEVQGLRFLPDSYGMGRLSEIQKEALTKVISTAILARAQQIAEAPNEQFILASDNILRWKGFEVARMVAGISELEPDLQFSADEHLGGSHREWVEARLKAFLRHHVSSNLKPLFDLRTTETLPEAARGIAFQLIEALGVLDRTKVGAEVKGLDQAVRGAMRKLGVRFGAHHIYAPATLKPKPRALAMQLWLLKRNEPLSEAASTILALAQSGRTTWPADATLDPDFYRVLGYKLIGARAVRVDILERLADLIRPVLAYRENITPGPPPPARVGREGFIVSPEMTSLLGCSSEDMALTLRALGYVSQQKPRAEVEAKIKAAQETYAAKNPTPVIEAASATIEAPKVEVEIITKEKSEKPVEAEIVEPKAETESVPKELPTTIDVWHFPRPARSFERRPRKPKPDGAQSATNQNKSARDKSTQGGKPGQDGKERPRHKKRMNHPKEKRENVAERRLVFSTENKKDNSVDPNNPFAKLAALKAQLDQKTT
jgi:ATP-dependent RNA helicase SUPV3L1/SUV3